ncbi:conserved Plasmodium protein, unknown function [Plasmodium knowlesi strain H]|uniref:Uncharacterized protein n=3 Tax=Plasmodium knowlesi TaxID=5850 RepID=A0A5K1VQT2_PLAKH|nr:conserved Plasmodium protein, unknown function [Plasmodium knowlesi strain H]OTN64402.1 Uncharacterized protein PKNOH_S130170000 [Plasmodium knowlesi]CAA9988868.1 conserved Plasmodium protein, unknown function [Plasmodium knowlesi strain H]SBO24702.1 conserved Plasmodium protein, unknown function [Plasmodium knowlesi strain H]SBO27977.1 conserved Plasmodium protein, unknown function [Plasmodium knowlesi strain H]VVS78342.1 conserved Plasmodium protein, unknown function [Plasmodium knowlesi |eukprot:XP_002261214.1 hypothetical protein, conserved in Plasmodium species [Plasmodium knowlesi strain H]
MPRIKEALLILYLALLPPFSLIFPMLKTKCVYVGKDYLQDLQKMGIFEKNSSKIRKEVFESINRTHETYSSCRTCIKLIQLIGKIIEKKKEPYVDIAIEDTLETNLCDSNLWHEHFNYDELLYSEHILNYCKVTLNVTRDSIEKHIYQFYNKEELFYRTVCLHINPVCKTAIEEERINISTESKVKLIYQLYCDYLTGQEHYSQTTQGVPYKKIESADNSKLTLMRSDYTLVQSEIGTMHHKKLADDFAAGKLRLLRISELADDVLEVFLRMKEQDVFKFLFYCQSCEDHILEVKIKIHRVSDNIDSIIKESYQHNLIDNDRHFLLYKRPVT